MPDTHLELTLSRPARPVGAKGVLSMKAVFVHVLFDFFSKIAKLFLQGRESTSIFVSMSKLSFFYVLSVKDPRLPCAPWFPLLRSVC